MVHGICHHTHAIDPPGTTPIPKSAQDMPHNPIQVTKWTTFRWYNNGCQFAEAPTLLGAGPLYYAKIHVTRGKGYKVIPVIVVPTSDFSSGCGIFLPGRDLTEEVVDAHIGLVATQAILFDLLTPQQAAEVLMELERRKSSRE